MQRFALTLRRNIEAVKKYPYGKNRRLYRAFDLKAGDRGALMPPIYAAPVGDGSAKNLGVMQLASSTRCANVRPELRPWPGVRAVHPSETNAFGGVYSSADDQLAVDSAGELETGRPLRDRSA